jgi:hypothetical protein
MRGILLKRQYISDFIECICALKRQYISDFIEYICTRAHIYSCNRAHIYIYMYISRFCTDLWPGNMIGILLRFISRVTL